MFRYQVLPSSRVRSAPMRNSRNSPRSLRSPSTRCGASTCRYGLHSSIVGGCERTSNPSRRGGSHCVIGLDEGSSGEFAGANRADTRAVDARSHRVGDAEPENQFAGRRKLGDADNVPPDRFGRRVDVHRGGDFAQGRTHSAGFETGKDRPRAARRVEASPLDAIAGDNLSPRRRRSLRPGSQARYDSSVMNSSGGPDPLRGTPLEEAIAMAARAHAGQVDRGGAPYILHPLRVMRHLLYVACTRARGHLLVTSVEPASEFLDDMRS